MDTQLTTPEPDGGSPYRALTIPEDEVQMVLRDNLGAGGLDRFSLTRTSVPTGGTTIWTIPGVRGNTGAEEIRGVLVGWADKRAFWKQEFKPSEVLPPDCASEDGIYGVGVPGSGPNGQSESCDVCPLAQFGSHRGGFGQACKMTRVLLMLRESGLLPLAIFAPPTSLASLRRYFLDLTSEGIPYHAIETSLRLEVKRAKSGYDVGEIKPRMVGELDEVTRARARNYAGLMKTILAGVKAADAGRAAA
jgi:hypothetical protein